MIEETSSVNSDVSMTGRAPSAASTLLPTLTPSVAACLSLLDAAGTLASVFAATSVAGYEASTSQKSFERDSSSISSTLTLAIQH